LAPEGGSGVSHGVSPSDTDAQRVEDIREGSESARTGDVVFTPNRTPFVTRLLPETGTGQIPVRLFTVGETAERLKVSRATVYKLVAKGLLPHVRVASAIRIRSDELTRFGASLPRLR
jgi:excisionase family DNA binding protein